MDPAEEKTNAPLDDFRILEPDTNDVLDEVERLDGFQEFMEEIRGDSLTFGDF